MAVVWRMDNRRAHGVGAGTVLPSRHDGRLERDLDAGLACQCVGQGLGNVAWCTNTTKPTTKKKNEEEVRQILLVGIAIDKERDSKAHPGTEACWRPTG